MTEFKVGDIVRMKNNGKEYIHGTFGDLEELGEYMQDSIAMLEMSGEAEITKVVNIDFWDETLIATGPGITITFSDGATQTKSVFYPHEIEKVS